MASVNDKARTRFQGKDQFFLLSNLLNLTFAFYLSLELALRYVAILSLCPMHFLLLALACPLDGVLDFDFPQDCVRNLGRQRKNRRKAVARGPSRLALPWKKGEVREERPRVQTRPSRSFGIKIEIRIRPADRGKRKDRKRLAKEKQRGRRNRTNRNPPEK
jgi:hypothetical protein